MKARICLIALFAFVLLLIGLPASAQILYENGPINGETDAWTINEGFVVSDTFTISTGNSTINGLSFGAWLFAGDTLESVEVSLTSEPFGGTTYFDQQVNLTASNCFVNNFGFNVCTETGSFDGPTLGNGTYWLNLLNGVVDNGDPVYWDENSGIGCHSEGCPSQACEPGCIGSIPSEAFSILGTSSGTGSVPEPTSLALFVGGFAAVAGGVRRKFWS
jgi:PEP-CTERM motif